MSKFSVAVSDLRNEWFKLEQAKRDFMIANFRILYQTITATIEKVPKSLQDVMMRIGILVLKETISPLGMGFEKAVITVLSEIPEFSPYIRQLFGD